MSLLIRINQFCQLTRLPRTKFGRLAVNDPRLVDDLANGRELGAPIVERIERFMREFRP